MINIFYDNDGNIVGFSPLVGKEWESFNHASINKELEQKISINWSRYKVDVDSKEFKIIDVVEELVQEDPLKNKLIQIPRIWSKKLDLKIVIKTINNRPHIVINADTDDNRKFDVYLTKHYDPNFLYQTFSCETDKENVFEIDQVDYKKVFAGEISLYYYKVFNRAGYAIQ